MLSRELSSEPEPFDRIAYPFSLDARRHCTLWLPRVGLTREEADRLKAYIDALVTTEAQR